MALEEGRVGNCGTFGGKVVYSPAKGGPFRFTRGAVFRARSTTIPYDDKFRFYGGPLSILSCCPLISNRKGMTRFTRIRTLSRTEARSRGGCYAGGVGVKTGVSFTGLMRTGVRLRDGGVGGAGAASGSCTQVYDDNSCTQVNDDKCSTQVNDDNSSTRVNDDNSCTQVNDDKCSTQVNDDNSCTQVNDDNSCSYVSTDKGRSIVYYTKRGSVTGKGVNS